MGRGMSETFPTSRKRREVLGTAGTALVLLGSGCLGLLSDGESDRNQSHLYLSNHQEVNHDVEVEIRNTREGENLIDKTVTVTPDEAQTFYFPIGEEIDGRYPQIRATVRMVKNPENNDSATRSFPPYSSANYWATIEENGEIDISETAV